MRRYLLILFAGVLVTSCKQDATTEFVKEIRCYSDYSTVAWSDLSEKYFSMPKLTVNEDGNVMFSNRNIRGSRQLFVVATIPNTTMP